MKKIHSRYVMAAIQQRDYHGMENIKGTLRLLFSGISERKAEAVARLIENPKYSKPLYQRATHI